MSKADDILRLYPYIGDDIQDAQKELNRYVQLREEARNPLKGQALTGMPYLPDGNTSDPTYDQIEKIIDRYDEKIKKYSDKINELMDLQEWLDKAFAELSENERRILYQYYGKNMSIREMARQWKKGRDQMKNIIDFAVDRIRRIAM